MRRCVTPRFEVEVKMSENMAEEKKPSRADNSAKDIRTVVGEAEGIEGLFLCCIDSPKIGSSDIQLVGLKIAEGELTETERKNLGIARTYGRRTKEEIKGYLKGGRVCIIDREEVSK